MRAVRRALCFSFLPLLGTLLLTGCGALPTQAGSSSGRISVVAAENFWGSLAGQVGGSRVTVHSIITAPGVDPHAYEPTASDAVALAGARLAVVNGLGYDSWASRLLSADSGSGLRVLDVGQVLGLRDGDNPHQWYSPHSVETVIAQIASDLCEVDGRDCAYFQRRRAYVEQVGLRAYHGLIESIRHRYAGIPVGYSESIFAPLGQALGLRLLTPDSFARAVAEGAEITASDTETVDRQARAREIAVWIYNRQNAVPDVQRVVDLARAAGVPVVTITETLDPATASFQEWQVGQLRRLEQALHEATGR